MIKYAKIVDEETKQCQVGTGTNTQFYQSIGMVEMDVEQAYNGQWYVAGYAPAKPEPTEYEKAQARIAELKKLLADSDYVVIKIAEGVSTADDYSEILNSRKAWRAEINELELVVDNTNTAL